MRFIHLYKQYFIWSLGVLMVFQSCTDEPEAENFVNIDYQYELKLSQQLSPNGGVPALTVSTLVPQDCTNSYISHHTIVLEDKFRLFLNDIHTEGECIAGNQIIAEEIGLSNALSVLPLEINLKNIVVNEGSLISGQEQYEMDLDNFDGLKLTRTKVNRIHPGMIWGSFSSKFDETGDAITQLIDQIQEEKEMQKGDYGHFYIGQDESITLYNSLVENEFTFLVSTPLSIEEFKNKIQEIKELDESLVFSATNYDGSTVNIH
ncbi:MAG: hypothetical protein P1U56_20075 [Saprospiraceae bacterium]|nr:hypothetical protein [Saprospiraceae bacterium]